MATDALRFISGRVPQKMRGPVLVALAVFYLVFQVLSGEHGVYALLKDERQLEILKAELNEVGAQRKELDHKVRLMSSGSLDLDMLDEQSRKILDTADQNEVVIPLKK